MATQAEIKARRQYILRLMQVEGASPQAIYDRLFDDEDWGHVTLKTVQRDLRWLLERAEEQREFTPLEWQQDLQSVRTRIFRYDKQALELQKSNMPPDPADARMHLELLKYKGQLLRYDELERESGMTPDAAQAVVDSKLPQVDIPEGDVDG